MTCRAEILASAEKIILHSWDGVFTVQEVVEQMQAVGTRYKESTIRTHIVSRMCVNAPANHAVTYDDFERVDKGRYRLHSQLSARTLAEAWLQEHGEPPNREVRWVLHAELRTNPELVWDTILYLLERDLTDRQFGLLAAGELEDLLSKYGPQMIERVERQAGINAKFNLLLGGVWKNAMSDAIWERVVAARHKNW